jgi:hypothetical protein
VYQNRAAGAGPTRLPTASAANPLPNRNLPLQILPLRLIPLLTPSLIPPLTKSPPQPNLKRLQTSLARTHPEITQEAGISRGIGRPLGGDGQAEGEKKGG